MNGPLDCVWCGRPKAEHGPPGASEYAKAAGQRKARLCPVPGVTSQFYTSRHRLVGEKWRGGFTLICRYDGGEVPEEKTVGVVVEQSAKGKPLADVYFVDGQCVFSVLAVTADSLDQFADFLNEAADMIRHCSK
jgi:hypothetical protein